MISGTKVSIVQTYYVTFSALTVYLVRCKLTQLKLAEQLTYVAIAATAILSLDSHALHSGYMLRCQQLPALFDSTNDYSLGSTKESENS